MSNFVVALTLVAILGSGLVAGTFFAFSTFVMPALASRPASEAIPAMQEINVLAVRTFFIAVFLGTAAASLTLLVVGFMDVGGARTILSIAGAVSYLLGFLVTAAFNVPRNNFLADKKAGDADAERIWNDYYAAWTKWNHVRTVLCSIACLFFAGSLITYIFAN